MTAKDVCIRFAPSSGVDAARQRAEVGAPESLDRQETFDLEADVDLDLVARAEGAGVLQRGTWGVLPHVPAPVTDIALGAVGWGQEPAALMALWVDLLIADQTARVQMALDESLARPVEDWIDWDGAVCAPGGHRKLWPLMARDERYQDRMAAAKELVARREAEKEAAKRKTHEELLARFNALDPREWLDGTNIEGTYVTWSEIQNRGFVGLSQKEIEPRLAEFSEAQAERHDKATQRIAQAEAQFAKRALAIGGAAALAVERGYGVHELVLQDIFGELQAEHKAVAIWRANDAASAEWEKRDSPTQAAMELEMELDQVAEHIEKPACVEIEVSPVCRIAMPDVEQGEIRKFTGIVVTITSPITGPRSVVFSTE